MPSGPNKIVFFGHHKCGSRFFRKTLLDTLARSNGYEVLSYSVEKPPFHYDVSHDLDLFNVDFDRFSSAKRCLLNLSNAGAPVVERVFAAAPDLKGVHVIRDPRQILVSGYLYHLKGHNTDYAGWVWDRLKQDRAVLQSLSVEDGLLYEMENITADVLDNQLASWRPHANVIEFKLEEFGDVESYAAPAMQRLLNFLEFESLLSIDFGEHFTNPNSKHWRSLFTPRVEHAFKRRFGGLLIDLGYEPSFDWTAKDDALAEA